MGKTLIISLIIIILMIIIIIIIIVITITETNNLINAASIYVAKELGLKQTTRNQSKMPCWKRRIEGDIKKIRKGVNMLERVKEAR